MLDRQGIRHKPLDAGLQSRPVLARVGLAHELQQGIGRETALTAQLLKAYGVQHVGPHIKIALIEPLALVAYLDAIECSHQFALDIAARPLLDCTEQCRPKDTVRHAPHHVGP